MSEVVTGGRKMVEAALKNSELIAFGTASVDRHQDFSEPGVYLASRFQAHFPGPSRRPTLSRIQQLTQAVWLPRHWIRRTPHVAIAVQKPPSNDASRPALHAALERHRRRDRYRVPYQLFWIASRILSGSSDLRGACCTRC